MKNILFIASVILIIVFFFGCQPVQSNDGDKKTIVVTYSILGSVIKSLVGDMAEVIVSIPNGQDPHEWQPSARDIENINNASLVISNGLDLESGLINILENAELQGVPIFKATDYVTIRYVGEGETISGGAPDQVLGAPDPHIWTDPLTMQQVVAALGPRLETVLNIDIETQAKLTQDKLTILDQEINQIIDPLTIADRKLVTGHESLGYFAQRYNFKLIGAIIPNISTQAGVTASDLATLKVLIQKNHVKAIFSELGTSSAAAETISKETGIKIVELNTHRLPADGQYATFMKMLAQDIVEALK